MIRRTIMLAAAMGLISSALGAEHVVLLHGMCRTSRSMDLMAAALVREGFHVWNIDYPSRTAGVSTLADDAIGAALATCRTEGATTVHFVTHSLGGILVRDYFSRHDDPLLGRVVMLAPPNRGSEIVDCIGHWKLYRAINGPVGLDLGTDAASAPMRLGAATFPLGVIAGDRSINWINSWAMIPGPDDGKVSVERTKLEGMSDHLVVHTTHPMIMRNRTVIRQTIAFLRTGAFQHE